MLTQAVAAAGLGEATTVLGPWPVEHYGGTGVAEDPRNCTQFPSWKANNSEASRWMDEEGSVSDGRLARCLARCVNRNYVSFCKSATIQWHLISSFYDYLPWARCGVAVANTPWSGAYEVTAATWALAHTTQFAPIGWRYTRHFAGVQFLAGGGSVVTRVSPDGKDFSIVLEKMTASASACARGNNPDLPINAEHVTIQLDAGLREGVTHVQVWFSNMSRDDGPHGNPDDDQMFVHLRSLPVGADGAITLPTLFGRDEMYTLTTLTTGHKGSHPSRTAADPNTPLPLPHTQTFDDEAQNAPGRFWYTQMGAFEVLPARASGAASVAQDLALTQTATVWPNCWNSNDCDPPKVLWSGLG